MGLLAKWTLCKLDFGQNIFYYLNPMCLYSINLDTKSPDIEVKLKPVFNGPQQFGIPLSPVQLSD